MSTPSPAPARPCTRTVVLGATPAGLAVAMRLAAKRHHVTVVDASPRAGGRLLGYEAVGLAFDPGVITLPAVFRDLFLKTGAAVEDEIDLRPVERGRELRFADGSVLSLPGVGVGLAAQAIADALGDDARRQWTAFMQAASDRWASSRQEAWTQKSTDAIVAGTATAPVLARRRDGLRATSAAILRDPRLRALVDDIATSLGADADHAPSALATRPYVELAFGLWQVGGGRRMLADALTRRAVERGIELRLGTAVVDRHATSDGRQTLDLADGTTLDADIVVDAVSSASLYGQSLTDDPAVVPPYERRRGPLRSAARSAARLDILVAVDANVHADVGARARPVDTPTALTTWFGADPASAARDALDGRLADDPTIRACIRESDTNGSQPWTVSVTVPRTIVQTHVHDPALAHDYAGHVLDVLAARGTDLRTRGRIVGVHVA